MRNLDLDQFWPMPPHRPRRQGDEAAYTPASLPPPLPQTSFRGGSRGEISSSDIVPPPPLSFPAAEGPQEPAEASLEAIAAAAVGWVPGELEPHPAYPHSASGADAPAPPATDAVSAAREAFADPQAASPSDQPAQSPSPEMVAPEPQGQRKRRDFTPAIWGGIGFFAGIFAWHAIGFWSFLSDVVLEDTRKPGLTGLAAHTPREPALTTGALPAKGSPPRAAMRKPAMDTQFACVSLALDRQAGLTTVGACVDSATTLRDAGFNRRSDRLALRPRLQDPVAWTGSTAVEVSEAAAGAPAAEPAAAEGIGTLTDADLKLDLD